MIFANQIQTTFGGYLKSESNLICTEASSVRTFYVIKPNPKLFFRHSTQIGRLDGASLRTRQSAGRPQSPTNVMWSIQKICTAPLIIRCPKDDVLPPVTALCMEQTSHCTVKPTVTAALNIVTFIGLFFRRVCLVQRDYIANV